MIKKPGHHMTGFVFEADRSEFSLVNALACARASLLAYQDTADFKKTAADWGFESAVEFSVPPNHAIVLSGQEYIVIAFRGTDGRADWSTNLNIFFKRSALGFVHRGFMKAAESFWPGLVQYVEKIRTHDQKVFITGHSLGGAIALLVSVRLFFEHKLPIAGLYTFGQPPAGTSSFCFRFNEQRPFPFYRFINHTDAVAALPILFREHTGEARYFDTSGTIWEGNPPWRLSLLDHIRAPGKYGGLSQFSAHSMKTYTDLLSVQRV